MKKLSSLIAIAVLFAICTSSSFAASAKVQKLSDHVYIISLLGFTSLVVVGETEVLITDTANPHRAQLLRKEIEKITSKPVAKIVLLHEHLDHNGGTEIFSKAELIAQQRIVGYNELDPLELGPKVIHQTYAKRMTINMGTTKVELLHEAIGDGNAVTILHLPAEKIVVTADLYSEKPLHPGILLSDSNLLGTRKILNMLAGWDLNHAVNVHSERTDIASLKAHSEFLNDLYDAILPILQSSLGDDRNADKLLPVALEMAQTLKLPKYKDWNNYNDLPDWVRKMAFGMIHGG